MYLSWVFIYTYVMGEDVGCCFLGIYYIVVYDIFIVNNILILIDSFV